MKKYLNVWYLGLAATAILAVAYFIPGKAQIIVADIAGGIIVLLVLYVIFYKMIWQQWIKRK